MRDINAVGPSEAHVSAFRALHEDRSNTKIL